MQHSPLISKIRCHHPNKKASRVCNRNYLEYVATREGVDLTSIDEEEMTVYRESENDAYAEYIAKRPGSHGLFGNIDVTDVKKVSNYVADLTSEHRNIYRGIVSLSEADAIALGYDEKQPWADYIRSALPDVALEFDIPITKVEWVAAVHMEKGHPHCHYMFWNKEDQIHSSFIHTSTQTRVRENLSGIMFQDERKVQVAEKTAKRNQIVSLGKEISGETVMGRIRNEHLVKFGKELQSLSEQLPTSGRFDYKLLPSAAKEKLNELVNIALDIPALKKEYIAYIKLSEGISKTYSPSKKHNEVNIAKANQDIRKRLANAILKSSKSILKNDNLLKQFADSINNSNYETAVTGKLDNHINNIEPGDINEILHKSYEENSFPVETNEMDDIGNNKYFYKYTKKYNAAAEYIYNSKTEIKLNDLKEAVNILKSEADNNVVAQLELGKIYEGNNKLQHMESSEIYYTKAYHGLEALLKGKSSKPKNYQYNQDVSKKKRAFATYEYKLGRLYENGKGTEQDFAKAKDLYERSAAAGNKYAAYSLGNMFLRGRIEEITPENQEQIVKTALKYFKQSADNEFGFAAYSYASNSEKYSFISITKEEADKYYKIALDDFIDMENKRPDATLQYRLGSMYMKGKGTEVNFEEAEKYFIKSANRGNEYAAYSLGNLYYREKVNNCTIDEKEGYFKKAAKYYKMAADFDFAFGAYSYANLCETEGILDTPEEEIQAYYKKALEAFIEMVKEEPEANLYYKIGCMYCDGKGTSSDIGVGIEYLLKAESLDSDTASYKLGKIYADPEGLHYNLDYAIQHFTKSAQHGNVYAKVKLGCIYLFNKEYKDIELGTQYLQEAIAEGNEIAKDILKNYQESRGNGIYSLAYQCLNSLFQSLQSGRTTRETFSELRRFRNKSKEQKKIDAKEQRGKTEVLPE